MPLFAVAATREKEVVPKTAEPEVALRPMTAGSEGFVILEDESGIGNFIVWPQIFGADRRILLGTSMLGVQVQVQREGEVTNLMVKRVTDLSAELASVGARESCFPLPHGRGDGAAVAAAQIRARGPRACFHATWSALMATSMS